MVVLRRFLLSSPRDEAVLGEADKWRQKRNNSFDQNRHLEEVTKERDGLKRVAEALQRAFSQLVAYCASAEDELNRTVLAQLLPKLLSHDSTLEDDSRPSTPDLSTSLVSRGKHVHFAPDLDSILGSLDEEGVLGFLQQQRDLSAELKKELEHSLRRLRFEAQELLDLSNKLALNKQKNEPKMLEASGMQITELVEEIETKHRRCDNCDLQRKNMEEAMSECLQRENLLRSDLESALTKIAHLMTLGDRNQSDDVVEGYGTGGVRASSRGTGWCSLDDAISPRHNQHEFDALLKERDDLQQQLEAANRQLKSTRQFVEEQASEREAERDEFAKRLSELREDNNKLSARLQSNTMILSEVEQLENQTRELNQMIAELETKKTENDKDLKTAAEEILLLRDIIAKLEAQLEQKSTRETEVLEQLEQMRRTIDERDSKMRMVLGELESLRSERVDISEVTCARCAQEEDRYAEYVEKIKEQAHWLEEHIHRRTRRLERTHEICSQPTSEPSEDVSIRDQKVRSPDSASPRRERLSELSRVWEGVEVLSRAEDAVLKRVNDLEMQRAHLNEIAQEVRAERDVLQARMSEQALKISSLSARLQQHRNDAEALAHTASSQLSVQLHDAQAEVQRLKEELESRDKQLSRLKQSLDEKDKLGNQHAVLYGNSCNPKDKVIILERELSSAQARIAHLENIATQLQVENEKLHNEHKEHQALLLDKEEQLNQIMALKLEEEQNQKSDVAEGKTSGRTLSDIVSISDYDEQDLQMRRTELKNQHNSFTAPREVRDKPLNKTLPPDVQRANMSSLNIENVDNFELHTPRADSLPVNFTYTPTKDTFKRNVNETTIFKTIDRFGEGVKHSTAQKIPDNCSLYPNQNISISNNVCVEPKKINFSLEASDQHEYTSLEELGITVDMKQENFPDILSQLKHEVKKSRTELTNCKMELKNAEEQLCEFPALKEEVEELKCLLENTMATMQKDKTFYESQLENFSSNKKALEQKLSELTQEVSEKSKDLNLLKEDILRRENMILELAKEKRNLNAKISELETRIDDLQKKNTILENSKAENQKLRDKISELDKLEQLVSEKNQQIDSLNQHLDRLDDLQRCLNNKTDEAESLKAALDKKTKELFQVQDSILGLNRDITKVVEENDQLNNENKELKLNLSKLEKEQENASLKLQNSESELERVSALNNDLTAKIEELKLLTEQLKDKNTEIEILNEDINSYHNEIASLKEQLKMVSRSPSPKNKNGEEKRNDRQANSDKKQLAKIKKQISLLQHELDFHKKELNDKAFELAKAKLDVTELKSNLSEAKKKASDLEMNQHEMKARGEGLQKEVTQLQEEKQQLAQQLQMVLAKLREESNISELKQKVNAKTERCRELEIELENMRDLVERLRGGAMYLSIEQREGARSPTAELESALRQQVHHSRTLDEDIMDQIFSASSDDREDIPRLALNSSKSSGVESSSGERYSRLRASCDRLQLQVDNLQARLADKDALIQELQRIRDKLTSECEGLRLRGEAQSDNSARLQLLLDAQQDTAAALQKQDSSMISMLKRRLEGAMKSELELRDKEQQLLNRIQHLESRTKDNANDDRLAVEVENVGRLKGEVRVLKSKLEMERSRYNELQSLAEAARQQTLREADARTQLCVQLKTELAELRRLKHEASVELVRAKELLNIQKTTITQLKQELVDAHRLLGPTELDDTRYLMESPRPPLLTPTRPQLSHDEKENAIRYLQGRCLRLESWRKSLVWQKRYLQRVLSGFYEMERRLMPAKATHTPRLRGKRRFRCIVRVVVTVIRMEYLVRRRHQIRSVAAACLLREVQEAQTPINTHPFCTPIAKSFSKAKALNLSTPIRSSPLAARLLKHDLPKELPQEQGEDNRRSGYNSPRETRYILSSPRGETASAYLNKLDTVSRCLGRTLDKDVP